MSVKDVSQVAHLTSLDGAKLAARPEPEPDQPTDRVSVEKSQEMAEVFAAARQAAATSHAQELEALATAVRQGGYRPDPQRIAEQILEDAELIAKLHAMLKR